MITVRRHAYNGSVGWLVGWSLTSLFGTNMATAETKGQGVESHPLTQ